MSRKLQVSPISDVADRDFDVVTFPDDMHRLQTTCARSSRPAAETTSFKREAISTGASGYWSDSVTFKVNKMCFNSDKITLKKA
ncbi:hypothetical protein Cantr_00731 [Candida viswanathii]|uniref:Uncharacterized protein n=1 Tax=Candida viswanathii TaxID=5486 RepID=A0A367YH89_9ASCO|nr:hypothetical protein Cantr_00731 [Candida viswanathii]